MFIWIACDVTEYMESFNCVQKMQFASVKNVIKNVFANHIYLICMCKQDLALNKLKWLICPKTQPNQIHLIYTYNKDLALNNLKWLIYHKAKLKPNQILHYKMIIFSSCNCLSIIIYLTHMDFNKNHWRKNKHSTKTKQKKTKHKKTQDKNYTMMLRIDNKEILLLWYNKMIIFPSYKCDSITKYLHYLHFNKMERKTKKKNDKKYTRMQRAVVKKS